MKEKNFISTLFKRNLFLQILVCIAFAGLFTNCNSDNTPNIYMASSQLALRQTPSPQGKFLSDIMIGEEVTLLDSTFTDTETKREYIKVQLSDKKQGWALKNGLLPLSKLGVTMYNATIYKRPQMATKLPEDSIFFRLVLFDNTKAIDSFVPVTSIYGTPIGWVRQEYIGADGQSVSTKKNDIITVLYLISKKLIRYDQKIQATNVQRLDSLQGELGKKEINSEIIEDLKQNSFGYPLPVSDEDNPSNQPAATMQNNEAATSSN